MVASRSTSNVEPALASGLLLVAIAVPTLLAFNVPPSATLLNQAAALAGWGVAALMLSLTITLHAVPPRGAAASLAAIAALLILSVSALVAPVATGAPWPLALSSTGTIFAAAVTLVVGVTVGRSLEQRDPVFHSLCLALFIAGLLSVLVALIQSFVPQWADGNWIARPATPGRAGGNLRQPNHLSSLLVWSLAALACLHEAWVERPRDPRLAMARVASLLAMGSLVLGVVLTVSRTGMVCVLLLAVWGVVDRRLSRFTRILLLLMPVLYVLSWMLATAGVQTFAGDSQIHGSDPSSSRFGIWANALSLIAQHPWLGVGWGEFNFAWTLTPFPGRPGAFFDHTHNLPLQLLVELGIPLGTLVMALLLWALWKAFVAARRAASTDGLTQRGALVMVLTMAVHSMLEYPLWYAYFLLPTAFAFGICLGGIREPRELAAPAAARRISTALAIGSALLVVGAIVSVLDYMRVVVIFSPPENAAPLPERIADGQRSWLFAHHADYAAGTIAEHPGEALGSFKRSTHYLLDTRLMMAWAKALEESGDTDRARYVAQRLREFNNPGAAEFFAPCEAPKAASTPLPFQCLQPSRPLSFEDFR
ncbi:Wzy polymerase domain-containing protein [Rhizobacter sp. P5_C2]